MDYTGKLDELKDAVKGLLFIYINKMYEGYENFKERMKTYNDIKIEDFNDTYDENEIDEYIGNEKRDINNLYYLIKYYQKNKNNKDNKDKLNQIRKLFEKKDNKLKYNSLTNNKDLDKLNQKDIDGLKLMLEMFKDMTQDKYKNKFDEKLNDYIKSKYDITKLKD